MITARFLVAILATAVAAGGVTAAVADSGGDDLPAALEAVELRKDDGAPDVDLVDDDENDDPTGDRDKTRGDDGTNAGHNHDGDATGGGDGDNSEVAVAAAPAPVYDDYSDDGFAYSGS